MIINITNKSMKDREVTCLDNGAVNRYAINSEQSIQFESTESLAEIECDGTVLLVPTVADSISYTIIDDLDIVRGRKQTDILYIILLLLMCTLSVILLNTHIVYMIIFLIIQALIMTGIYRILKTEQKGEVVFIEG